ncbi:MAG: hypothetical protein JXB47_16000 [Anaerolineae bacterium]|nr:hypothetical protein [Anaerolineae bacterium]
MTDAPPPLTAPGLVIGLGDTGCRVAGLAPAHAAQTHPPAAARSLHTLGIGFGAPPPGAPPGAYVQLCDDIPALLAHAGPEAAAWLDVDAYRARCRPASLPPPDMPRPLERLALFADLRLGRRSQVVNAVLGGWTALARAARGLSVSVVAALAEPGAGSILVDILHLVGEIAKKRGESVTRWAYLVLPSAEARHAAGAVRGFAALRELARLMVYNDPVYGEPMSYISTLTDSVWNGHLRAKPIDQLYLFDYAPPEHIAPQLASLLLVRAGPQVHDRVRADAVNQYRALPDRAEGRWLCGALGSYSVTLPAERLVEQRAVQHALDALRVCLADGAAPDGSDRAGQFLLDLSAAHGAALGRPLAEWARERDIRTLADRLRGEAVHKLDRWLFAGLDAPALLRAAHLKADAERLRFDVGKPPPDDSLLGAVTTVLRVDAAEYLQAASALLALFDASDERDDPRPGAGGAYRKLAAQAAASQAAHFRAALTDFLQHTLNGGVRAETSPAALLALLAALADILQHARDALQLAAERHGAAALDAAHDAYRRTRRALLDDAANRWAMRDTIVRFAEQTQQYVEAVRVRELLAALLAAVTDFLSAARAAGAALRGWVDALRDHAAELAARLATLHFCEAVNQRLIVPSDWDKVDPLNLVGRLRWQVDLAAAGQEKIALALDAAVLDPSDRASWAVWLDAARAPFERFAARRSVLDHLPAGPEVLAEELRAAETQMLTYRRGADSVQNVQGLLVAGPVADAPHHHRYVGAVHDRLNANQGAVQRQDGADRSRLSYLFITERIDLMDEVPAYAALAERYRHTPGSELQEQHVLAAERWAVYYERRLTPPDFEPRTLHPRVVALLAHHERCAAFLHAETLGLVRVTERLEAMRRYTSGGPDAPDADPDAVREALNAYIIAHTDDAAVGRTAPALRANLAGARARGLYAEMVATLAVLDLFNDYDARLAALRASVDYARDPVNADLLDLSRLLLRPYIERMEKRALQYGRPAS